MSNARVIRDEYGSELPTMDDGCEGETMANFENFRTHGASRIPSLAELRCDDCAFREGTQANSQESTRLKAQLCAEIPVEFLCHRREGLCAGWAELANKLHAEGYYATQPDWQLKLKVELLEILSANERGDVKDGLAAITEAIDKVEPKPRTIPEIAGPLCAQELEARKAEFYREHPEEEINDAPAERELWRNR